jgi:hypothetical protein
VLRPVVDLIDTALAAQMNVLVPRAEDPRYLQLAQAAHQAAAYSPSPFMPLQQRPPGLLDQEALAQTSAALRAREKLDDFLLLRYSNNREYVVRRLQELARGALLAEYVYNGGGRWRGELWNPSLELPTDSQLVFHLLCIFMDMRLPPTGAPVGPFSGIYYYSYPDALPAPHPGRLLLYQAERHPNPHFQIVYQSAVYDVPRGRENLFQALVLFFRLVEAKFSFYIGNIHLSRLGLDLAPRP